MVVWGRVWHGCSCLQWLKVVGKNLDVCGQGTAKWIQVALLAGCYPSKVGVESGALVQLTLWVANGLCM